MSTPDPACQFYVDENLLKRFSRLFVHRHDTYAVQREDGSYVRVEGSLTHEVLRRHLAGEITIGVYQINPVDNTAKWLTHDIDPEHLEHPQQVALALYDECTSRFSPRAVLLEASRWPDPSFHVWTFFEPPFPAKAARWLGRRVMEHAGVVVELFPKQNEVKPGDFGNLMKLPLGLHRKEGKWSTFLKPTLPHRHRRRNDKEFGHDMTEFSAASENLCGHMFLASSKVLEGVEGCTFSERDTERILKLADRETTSVQVKLGGGTVVPRTMTRRASRKVRPCFQEALNDHALPHDMRLALAIEYLATGYGVDKVTALFKGQEDFNERKTRYQVEHALRKGYPRRKCATIQALGYCIGEPCPIFRRRRRRFERIGVF